MTFFIAIDPQPGQAPQETIIAQPETERKPSAQELYDWFLRNSVLPPTPKDPVIVDALTHIPTILAASTPSDLCNFIRCHTDIFDDKTMVFWDVDRTILNPPLILDNEIVAQTPVEEIDKVLYALKRQKCAQILLTHNCALAGFECFDNDPIVSVIQEIVPADINFCTNLPSLPDDIPTEVRHFYCFDQDDQMQSRFIKMPSSHPDVISNPIHPLYPYIVAADVSFEGKKIEHNAKASVALALFDDVNAALKPALRFNKLVLIDDLFDNVAHFASCTHKHLRRGFGIQVTYAHEPKDMPEKTKLAKAKHNVSDFTADS